MSSLEKPLGVDFGLGDVCFAEERPHALREVGGATDEKVGVVGVGEVRESILVDTRIVEVFCFLDCFPRDEVVHGECGELLREKRKFIAEDNTLARATRVEKGNVWHIFALCEVSNDAHAGSDTDTTRNECEVQREWGVGVEKAVRE